MRMRRKHNLDERLARAAQWIVAEPETLRGQWGKRYARETICLEIGCGKGRFVIETAKANPDCLYIGLEREQGALVMAAEKAMESEIPNLVFLDADAAALDTFFAPGELARIYLNFSDPWPKNKQAKRRLTHRGFLAQYRTVLRDGGEIFQKTDNEKLFAFSLCEFSAMGFLLQNITLDLHATDTPNIMTEYEERFAAQGMRIYRAEAVKQ